MITASVPVNTDAPFTFNGDEQLFEKLPERQGYLSARYPMQNNQLDIVREGGWVKNVRLNDGSSAGGADIFKIKSAGSLQGIHAARVLVYGIIGTNVDDTSAETPFFIDDTGISVPEAQQATTIPVQPRTQPVPLQYAPAGAIVLIAGILLWCRR